ncbi:hypothetical protein JCM19274_2789 [Algibacter lectus]|uniref:Polysaccharide lyase family 8 central domain-containing protein n=1 Tax=Algibacter lectus TaxID=221126 RepID=A0A090X0K8_9FLAO|nr:polysaccharide lyase family 8 super-sandwich domain-containing protein [Algibacter lectus]GAL82078.1 hypothetical protein JCM19274_2789 [Algibacter lectus]
MQTQYGVSLLQRHDADLKNITPGYNFSRALGVTSVASGFSTLEQLVYQKGTSGFVGGVSNSDGMGVFVQEFDATKSDKYANTVASALGFKKSYFFFDNDVVLLASDISNDQKNSNLETGLLQESATDGKNDFAFSNKLKTSNDNYDLNYSSTKVPWMFNNSLHMAYTCCPIRISNCLKANKYLVL